VAAGNYIGKLVNAGKFDDAQKAFSEWADALPQADRDRLGKTIVEAGLVEAFNGIKTTADTEAFLERLEENDAPRLLGAPRIKELRDAALSNEVQRISNVKGTAEAIAWGEDMRAMYGATPQLDRSMAVVRQNRAIEYHNSFAQAYNARDYSGALLIIKDAVAEFPSDRRLAQDLSAVEKTMR
jgi:hypothetical protein